MNRDIINIEMIKKIPIEAKTRILQGYIQNDVKATKMCFDLNKGIEQVPNHPSGYIPGIAGHLILTRGITSLKNLSLGEEDVNQLVLLILKTQDELGKITNNTASNNEEGRGPISFPVFDAAKVIRESFQIIE